MAADEEIEVLKEDLRAAYARMEEYRVLHYNEVQVRSKLQRALFRLERNHPDAIVSDVLTHAVQEEPDCPRCAPRPRGVTLPGE